MQYGDSEDLNFAFYSMSEEEENISTNDHKLCTEDQECADNYLIFHSSRNIASSAFQWQDFYQF